MPSKSRGKSTRRATSASPGAATGAGMDRGVGESQAQWYLAGLILITVAVYAGVWSFDFVHFDDPEYIINNKAIAGGLNWSSIQWAFTTGYIANWHPVTWLSHALDVSLFGVTGGPPHLVNLLLHL